MDTGGHEIRGGDPIHMRQGISGQEAARSPLGLTYQEKGLSL